MRLINLTVAAALIHLPALAAPCPTAPAVSAIPTAASPDFTVDDSAPGGARLIVADAMVVRVGDCALGPEHYLCLQIGLPPGAGARLTEPTFRLARAGAAATTLPIPLQQTMVICQGRGQDPVSCALPATITTQLDAPKRLVRRTSSAHGSFEQWMFALPPRLAVTGSLGGFEPLSRRLTSKYARWALHPIQLANAGEFDGQGAVVELPAIEMDGKAYRLPPFRVTGGGGGGGGDKSAIACAARP